MATAEAPDPRDFESWEDAFKYPIPAVRGMEKKLRAGANENREKLKTLVGVSYRELLGTAHTIIQADSDIHNVESLLIDVGRRCDSRILNKTASNHVRLQPGPSLEADNHQTRRASQLFLLQQSLKSIARILRTNGSSLFAAKLLVVSRLLHKTLPVSDADTPNIDTLFGKRLTTLRAKLLRHIDRRLARSYNDQHTDLVQDLAAFALATSSAPSDVLRHYQYIRGEAVKSLADPTPHKDRKSIVLDRLQLYIATAREIRAIYPDLLQASLQTLSARPLLDDPSIRDTDELRLDSHAHWISPDVKHFTPWTRHEELSKSTMTQSLEVWSLAGFDAFVSFLKQELSAASDIQSVFDLRTDLFQFWLANQRFALLASQKGDSGLDSRGALLSMASEFTLRLKQLLQTPFDVLLESIKASISESLQHRHSPEKSNWALWDRSTLTMSIAHGASPFREAIVNQRSGREKNTRQILHAFEDANKSFKHVQQIIKQMREARWEDDDYLGSDESPYATRLLSDNESTELKNHLSWSASMLVRYLEEFIADQLTPSNIECSEHNSAGLFLLRAIRDLRRHVPLLLKDFYPDSTERLLFSDLITQFYARLAETITKKTTPVFTRTLENYVQSSHNPRGLWEGSSPALPIQITPATFQTLRAAAKEMEAFGPDIWAPDAAAVVRQAVDVSFTQTLQKAVENVEELRNSAAAAVTLENGITEDDDVHTNETTDDQKSQAEKNASDDESPPDEQNEEAEEQTLKDEPPVEEPPMLAQIPKADREAEIADKLTQLLFDAVYLSNALSGSAADGSSGATQQQQSSDEKQSQLAEQIVPVLVEKTGIDEAALARINKSAADYWRRTYLLFGLLCG